MYEIYQRNPRISDEVFEMMSKYKNVQKSLATLVLSFCFCGDECVKRTIAELPDTE